MPAEDATVSALPPNAPIGANHITMRIMPKMIPREHLEDGDDLLALLVGQERDRCRREESQHEDAQDLFSTNGWTKEPGRTWSVMNGTRPC